MSDQQVIITIKNADASELLAAGRLFYGEEKTAQEVSQAFKEDCIHKLRWIVKEYRNSLRDPVDEPTIGE